MGMHFSNSLMSFVLFHWLKEFPFSSSYGILFATRFVTVMPFILVKKKKVDRRPVTAKSVLECSVLT